ncbi:transcription factor SPT20 homolog isoform X3 [Protopterus annectens]|uniref:transcription factor SPT20 homolog isoform X3 n=1 Tax=Protopterus annectens TaxID=7888 RepID=UPI001CFB673E|nr:transcription factor SPT20 homolog isoform X3 [Protopterus annectens]
MQQALEYALDRAEYIIENARQRPPKRKHASSGRKSFYQKLYDLYIEECEKEPEFKKLRLNVKLLEKLVTQEIVSCLVVNLYPGNEGYSLMLRGKNGSDSETIRLPYEEEELLEYLDAEELPPVLVDLLDKSQSNIFHCGCVITEIRDYRQCGNLKTPTYQSRHILLRPTMQTLICDIHAITSDSHKWTQEDKLLLESQLVLATAEPLCLDPSIAVTCTTNRLLYNKQKMNTRPLKRCLKRYSRLSLTRHQELVHYPTPPQFRLFDYLQKRKERRAAQQFDLKISRAGSCVDLWKQTPCHLTAPSEVDVEKYATVEKPIKADDALTSVWPAHDSKDDYIFECEVGNPLRKTKVSIYQSVGDPFYYGRIQTAKNEEDEDYRVTHSQILFGSKAEADRFVHQFKEVFQNDAKCPVKMSHNPGGSLNDDQPSPEDETEDLESFSSLQSSLLGKNIQHRGAPVKLPSSSGGSPLAGEWTGPQGPIFSHDLVTGSGTPKQSPTNTPSSTPHPSDVQGSTPSVTPCVTPTPQDAGFSPQSALLTFTQQQQQMALSQSLPVMTIPLSTMAATSTTGTASSQVMANHAGLSFINVVGSVCGAPTLMSTSNSMLGCNTGAITSAGLNLTGILPASGMVPGALPAAMPSVAQAGGTFNLKNSSGLRPFLPLPGATSLIFNPQQQQQLQQYSPQQRSASNSPQPQDQASDQGFTSQDQTLAAQQAAVINLTGVGSFIPSQAAAVTIPPASNVYGITNGAAPAAFRQPPKK